MYILAAMWETSLAGFECVPVAQACGAAGAMSTWRLGGIAAEWVTQPQSRPVYTQGQRPLSRNMAPGTFSLQRGRKTEKTEERGAGVPLQRKRERERERESESVCLFVCVFWVEEVTIAVSITERSRYVHPSLGCWEGRGGGVEGEDG